MDTLTIPLGVVQNIQLIHARLGLGQIDWEGRKYVFCQNNNESGRVNPVHAFDLGVKAGRLATEGKINLLGKVFLRLGAIDKRGGEIAIFVYKIRDRKSNIPEVQP